MQIDFYPKRIICLTEETTETLYLLGAQDRIVGISGFTVRPKEARKEKPKVSAFIDANIDEILDLKPDLVIGFSDIQADIAKELISKGVTVWVNNHRSVEDILKMIVQLGSLVGKRKEAIALVTGYQQRILEVQQLVSSWNKKPNVYFEEWYDPLISGIQWVSELIEIAGGKDLFDEFRDKSLAKDRIIEYHQTVVDRNPDIILVSWCGKMFKPKKMFNREGWQTITAFEQNEVHEIDSSIILQPGPAALSEGLEQLHLIFSNWIKKHDSQ